MFIPTTIKYTPKIITIPDSILTKNLLKNSGETINNIPTNSFNTFDVLK